MKTLIWGAGREGRGFLADIFSSIGEIHLVDTNGTLVDSLRSAGKYQLLLRTPDSTGEKWLSGYTVWHAGDKGVLNLLTDADAVALCIYLEDMPAAVAILARGLEQRRAVNPDQPLDIFICANAIHYGPKLRRLFDPFLSDGTKTWFDATVGIVETLVRRTCVLPGETDGEHDSLAIMTNAFPTLVIDGAAVKGSYGDPPFLFYASDMRMEERRKIYTYNLLHVTYAYLGFAKGYTFINESRADGGIQAIAQKVYAESSAALMVKYDIDKREMEEYEQTMWSYVVNPAMPDSIIRTGCNPIRKLGRDERIIGPALLCLENNLPRGSIALVAAKAFSYDNPSDGFARKLCTAVKEKGIRACIEQYCGLEPDSPLVDEIVRAGRLGGR